MHDDQAFERTVRDVMAAPSETFMLVSQCCYFAMTELSELNGTCAKCHEYCTFVHDDEHEQKISDREFSPAQRQKAEEQDECPHDEHDHGICLDCGKDIFDDIVGAAEFARDCAEDR